MIQFNNTLTLIIISLSIILVVYILIKGIYRHNPHVNEQYGKDIILFHSNQRYEKRVWRFNLIEYITNKKSKTNQKLELKVVVGELSEDTLEIIKHAASDNFENITIIGGPKVFCEDKTEIYALIDSYASVKYFILPKRPNKHFMIFNKSHLYIEKPHRHNETRGAVGIKKANQELIERYDQSFNELIKHARQLNKEDVLDQHCYND
jgi:hypothetical protein